MSVNKKPCVHKDCDGGVRAPMVVCPSCGRCQTKKCFETDAKIRELIEEEKKNPRKPPKINAKSLGGFYPPPTDDS